MSMENEEKAKDVFAHALGIDRALVTDDLKYGSKEWDSIAHMVLISRLEEAFGVSIDTDEVIDLSGFAKAKEILSKKSITF